MFWFLIATILILITYIYVFMRQKTWIKRNVKQLNTTPLVGDNYDQLVGKESFPSNVQKIYNAFPNDRYVGVHQLNIPTLMLRDPELIKQLAVKDFDYFMDHRNFTNSESDPLWNKNLLFLTGDEWRSMRSTLSPAFTGSKMRAMFYLINDCAKQFTSFFLNKNEEKFDLEIKETFTRYANDVIATCAFGVNVDSLKEPNNEFFVRGKEATDFSGVVRAIKFLLGTIFPSLSRFLNVQVFSSEIGDFFLKLMQESIKMREENNLVRPDMINLLMQARKGKLKHEEGVEEKDAGFATVQESHVGKAVGNQAREMTDMDITAQALIFFFAGFETVSTAMSFFAYEMSANPDIQDKLIKEVDEIVATNGDITYDCVSKMRYLDMVLSEVLRKWPPVITMDRVCVRPYTIPPLNPGEKPVTIAVNDVLWLPVMAIHYDPKYYPNPNTFDPERFSEENKQEINPYTYFPFGIGPRNCIGSRFAIMEIKTLIFNILTKFKFVATEKSVIPLKIDKTSFVLSSEGGFWMALQKR